MAEPLSPRAEIERRLLHTMRQRLGPTICARLDDPQVVDVLLNPDGSVWEDRLGVGMARIGTMDAVAAESLISNVAATLHTVVNRQSPTLQAELPFRGARFEALVPPIVPAPAFAIRLKALKIHPLVEYVRDGIMTERQKVVIEDAAESRINILVAGGTGAGKSTLLNAIMESQNAFRPDARVVVLEDTIELQCSAENTIALRTSDTVSMRDLLKISLRLRPNSIIVGEVRGGEALDMLKAWNTGHDGGLCSVHANTARSALTRIEQLVGEASMADQRPVIGEVINMIVPIARTKTSRIVRPIIRVEGFHDGDYVLTELEP